ncbi:hypothetical protein DFJ73DRAFT_940646 [Zopfochytrium polystomum]|nr:hypothetical protein DFJ73DRAFT_940646 [Zopfochytrium polystomum]
MTFEDDDIQDPRAAANRDLFAGTRQSSAFSAAVKQLMLGKRGMVRGSTFSIRSMTNARGVAVPVWDMQSNEIRVPSRWLGRMKVPIRVSDGELLSPYFNFRAATDGDCGLLWRCPVISVDSLQPVLIRAWEFNCIGCHPNMCERLHLDFDGDEVHFCVVSSPSAVAEIMAGMLKESNTKFSSSVISQAYEQQMRMPVPDDGNSDFMLASTISITTAGEYDFDTPYYALCRCKEEPRMQVAATYSKEHNLDDIVQDSLKRMANVIESHLTVSSSYVVSRYLKLISAESTAADGMFDVQWLEASDQRPAIPRLTVPHGLAVYGLPGLRLATKLTEAMVQESLNRAKHQADDAQSEDLMSLLTGTGQVALYYSNSASDSLIKRTAHSDNVSSVVRRHGRPLFITSREHTQSLFNGPKSRLMSLLMMTSYICQKYSIPAARDEIVDFVSMLDASLETADVKAQYMSSAWSA